MRCASEIARFIADQTTAVALLPGSIELCLATDARGIFQAADAFTGASGWPPYWAFAWPGGQALARYIGDNARLVEGKRVLDLGAGSGIAAIAAARAGAGEVTAADPDPLALAAVSINAARNGVEIETIERDLLGAAPDADVILIGDLVYELELATRVTGFVETMRAKGATVIWADRTTARRPALPFALQAEYCAPLTPMLEESHSERARVWRLEAGGNANARRRRAA